MLDIGLTAGIIAAIGTPFTIHLAGQQLRLSRYGSDRKALAVRYDVAGTSERDYRPVTVTINAAGPAAFYELSAHLQIGDDWVELAGPFPQFDRNSRTIETSRAVREVDLGDTAIVIKWAHGAANSEGLDDRLVRIEVATGKRYFWREKRLVRLIRWWNSRAAEKVGDSHVLIRPTGRWARSRKQLWSSRSAPGWPGHTRPKLRG